MISRDSSPLVSLFAKAPVPGLVKTRMRAELGDQVCAELATRMLRDVAVRLEKHWPGPRAIAVTPDTDHPAVVEIAQRHGFALEKQTGSDLGERMGSALAQGISRFGSAVVLGADIPQLTAGELRAAQAGLSRGEEVLGPTLDGGFYLLGLHHWDARLFDGVQWGGQDVLRRVLENGRRLGRSFHMLATMRDIDFYTDLLWLARKNHAYRAFLHLRDRTF